MTALLCTQHLRGEQDNKGEEYLPDIARRVLDAIAPNGAHKMPPSCSSCVCMQIQNDQTGDEMNGFNVTRLSPVSNLLSILLSRAIGEPSVTMNTGYTSKYTGCRHAMLCVIPLRQCASAAVQNTVSFNAVTVALPIRSDGNLQVGP